MFNLQCGDTPSVKSCHRVYTLRPPVPPCNVDARKACNQSTCLSHALSRKQRCNVTTLWNSIIMLFMAARIDRVLRSLCRTIQFVSTAGLVLLIIHLWWGELNIIRPRRMLPYAQSGPSNAPTTRSTKHERCPANAFPSNGRCSPCPLGTFSYSGWQACQTWLNCTAISTEVQVNSRIPAGFTKTLWRATWKGHGVMFVNCTRSGQRIATRCRQGIERMAQLQGEYVTQLIGICQEKRQVKPFVFGL